MDADALERRRLALEKMDNAKFSLYHVRYDLIPLLSVRANKAQGNHGCWCRIVSMVIFQLI